MTSTQHVSPSSVTVNTAGMQGYVIWIILIPVYFAFSKENLKKILAVNKKNFNLIIFLDNFIYLKNVLD